ncbi:hypothetical protein [Magnetospirillum sp. 15-1]|uniref:hypothetical protein n=1 Tax=Magnetospirillum sp. 15-1 TaxID=1979370 RepID=UPI0011432225|nr:hypothetical protein [Magnetospirillum sp. 15-1]
MQIQAHHGHLPLIGGTARLDRAAPPSSVGLDAKLSGGASSGGASANSVSGSLGDLLSPQTKGQIIQQTQQSDDVATSQDNAPSRPPGWSDAVEHGMDDIANDPAIAALRAQQLAKGTDAIEVRAAVNDPSLSPEERAAQAMANLNKNQAIEQQTKAVQQQRMALYDSETAKGTPPAEIFAKLLQFNASQPQSYGDQLMPHEAGATWASWQTAQLEYLQGAMAKAGTTQAISQTQPDTTPA